MGKRTNRHVMSFEVVFNRPILSLFQVRHNSAMKKSDQSEIMTNRLRISGSNTCATVKLYAVFIKLHLTT